MGKFIVLMAVLLMGLPPAWAQGEADGDFIRIEGGIFRMGSPASEAWRSRDESEHTVTVGDFYMAACEVTQAEYEAVMKANPSHFSGPDLPVENITWFDAIAYCNARSRREGLTPAYRVEGRKVAWDRSADGYRLPTEAEWEYACRAGTTTPFNTETSIGPEEANYYGHYPYLIEENYFSQGKLETRPGVYRQTTVAVRSFAPNPWGLYTMHGNVGEWCWDAYGPYPDGAQENPSGAAGGRSRVSRGGGWNDFAKHIRSAYRASSPAEWSSASIGLRLARNAAPLSEIVSSLEEGTPPASGSGRALIVFYSWSGNTRGIAHEIQKQTGADLFEITLEKPYSSDYNTVLDEAQRDQRAQARPRIRGTIADLAQYDTVILGYPNWWASIPMPIASFLEAADLSGKTIAPFCSHGGGRFGQSLSVIAKMVPQARLLEGLSVSYSGGGRLAEQVEAWLRKNGLK